MLSLRGSSIGLSLVCVVASSTIAAYLATVSGDAALSNTKEQRDGALRMCFSVSADNSRGQAAKLMSSLEHDIAHFVRTFLSNAHKQAEAMTFELHHSSIERVWDWNRLESEVAPRLWSMVWRSKGSITAAGLLTAKEQVLWVYDDAATRPAPRNYHHHLRTLHCNGTDYGSSVDRLFRADVEWGTGQLMGGRIRDPGMPCGGYEFCAFGSELCHDMSSSADWQPVCDADGNCCICNRPCSEAERGTDRQYNSSVRIGVDVPDYDGCQRPAWTVNEKCRDTVWTGQSVFDGEMGGIWKMGALLIPHGRVLWTPIIPISTYLGMFAIGNWAPPETDASANVTGPFRGTAGICSVGLDSRTVSSYLQELSLEGLSRMYVVVQESSIGMAFPSNGEMLLAASKGANFRVVNLEGGSTSLSPIKPEESPDAVVSAIASNISSGHWGVGGSGYAGFVERNGARTVEVAVNLTGASDEVLGDGDGVDPENARFFVRISSEEAGSLGFWLVTAFDYNVILGEIERTNVATIREVDERNEQVSDDLAKDRTALFVILAFVAVGLCLVAVASTFAIVAPLRELGFEMDEVSRMKLDGVSTKLSFLSEIAICQGAFILMAEALAEYREFLPQSVLESDTEGPRLSSSLGNSPANSVTCKSPRGSWNRESSVPDSGSSLDGADKAAGPRRVNARGLQSRRCSLAFIGVHKWHLILERGEHSVLSVISSFIQGMMVDADATKGVCDSFSGDRMMVSFNAMRTTVSHREAAVEFGVGRQDSHKACTWWTGHADCHVTIALVAGELSCGNAGPPGMVRSCVLGPVMSWGHVLQRHMQQHRGWQRTATFADRYLAADASILVDTRVVSLISYPKRSAAPNKIRELMPRTGTAEVQEWMYELADAESQSRWMQWNDVLDSALSADAKWDGQLLATLQEVYQGDTYLEYLVQRATGEPVMDDLSRT